MRQLLAKCDSFPWQGDVSDVQSCGLLAQTYLSDGFSIQCVFSVVELGLPGQTALSLSSPKTWGWRELGVNYAFIHDKMRHGTYWKNCCSGIAAFFCSLFVLRPEARKTPRICENSQIRGPIGSFVRPLREELLEVPILVATRVIPRIVGSCGVVVPPACHCEMGFVSRAVQRRVGHFQG